MTALSLSGVWRSGYVYPSTGRGEAELISEHDVSLRHQGWHVIGHSIDIDSGSHLSLNLILEGEYLTGTWREVTDPESYYEGRVYFGAAQFVLRANRTVISGRWLGWGKEGEIQDGSWELTRLP